MVKNGFVRKFLPSCTRLEQQYLPKDLTCLEGYEKSESQTCPRVSLVVPSFNQAKYLTSTLESILSQGYPNLELFVVDGGSTDGSVDIIKAFQKELTWWVSEPDSGQANAINKGFSRSSGEIMAWLNSDDLLLPGALFAIAKELNEYPECDVVYGQRILINEDGKDIGKWLVPNHDNNVIKYADFIPQETLFWRRSLWDKAGASLDESFQFALDWDLILKFVEHKARFKVLNKFIGAFRFHPEQKTVAQISDTGFEEMERLRKQHAGLEYKSKRYNMKMRLFLYWFLIKAKVKELFCSLGLLRNG